MSIISAVTSNVSFQELFNNTIAIGLCVAFAVICMVVVLIAVVHHQSTKRKADSDAKNVAAAKHRKEIYLVVLKNGKATRRIRRADTTEPVAEPAAPQPAQPAQPAQPKPQYDFIDFEDDEALAGAEEQPAWMRNRR